MNHKTWDDLKSHLFFAKIGKCDYNWKCVILNNYYIIMKKILSTILGIFIAFLFCSVPNLLLAQWSPEDVGVNIHKKDCLMWVWENCFHYEKMMWIDDNQPWSGYTATSIAQDVVVSATYMVWTVLTIVIIVCWLWYIFSSASGKDTSKYKKWLIYAALWAILVRWAYAIVRLIQYVAKW